MAISAFPLPVTSSAMHSEPRLVGRCGRLGGWGSLYRWVQPSETFATTVVPIAVGNVRLTDSRVNGDVDDKE